MDDREKRLFEERILSARTVSFTYPEPDEHGAVIRQGTIKDRSIIFAGLRGDQIPYWNVIDLIEFPSEGTWIRFSYYRVIKGKLVFAGQYALTEPVDTIKELMVKTAREKPWFRQLLEDVMARI